MEETGSRLPVLTRTRGKRTLQRPKEEGRLCRKTGGEDRPELFFLRSQVPPAEGMEPLAGLDACFVPAHEGRGTHPLVT